MKVTFSDFRNKAPVILERAQKEDVTITKHGKVYAVVLSQERYNALLNQNRSGLDLFANIERFDLKDGELDHPPVRMSDH